MNQLILLLLLCCLNPSSSYAANAIQPFLNCLRIQKIPESIIYTTQSKNYTYIFEDHIRNSRFNTSTTPKPTLILTPSEESHVQQVVKCAKSTQTHLVIRSGGHDFEGLSYTTYSNSTPFAILDVFKLSSIAIDIATETAWVGSGATVGELYYRIWEKSNVHAFPAGVCPTMGIGGHISGGGYGSLLRKYGLSVDNVVDARIVDANGSILDRKAMGEDLFWAIRGGGGASFAVVLAYRLKLVPVPPTVTFFEVSKTVEENATEIVHRWQFVADKFDEELFVRMNLGYVQMKPLATFIGMYLGNSEKLMSVMTAQFPELGLKKEECKEMSWIRSVLAWGEFADGTPETALLTRNPGPPINIKVKSDYVTTPIPYDGVNSLFEGVKVLGQNGLIPNVKFNPYGGRMSEIPATATPFPHRAGNIFKVQYFIMWSEMGDDIATANIKKLNVLYDSMTPFVSKNPRRAFLNYRDIEVGNEYGIKYFGENFDRLVRVKTMVDPTNFFRDMQSVPLSTKL